MHLFNPNQSVLKSNPSFTDLSTSCFICITVINIYAVVCLVILKNSLRKDSLISAFRDGVHSLLQK